MRIPKTFNAYGHRYRIVYVTDTEANARRNRETVYRRHKAAVKLLTGGRWAVGIRLGSTGASGLKVK